MSGTDKHDEARALTEKALDELELGHEAKADKLIAEAKKLDPTGAAEVVADMEEDAEATGGITPPDDSKPAA